MGAQRAAEGAGFQRRVEGANDKLDKLAIPAILAHIKRQQFKRQIAQQTGMGGADLFPRFQGRRLALEGGEADEEDFRLRRQRGDGG